jgi:uncharacterized coiled-coil protein SlyX
LQDKGVPDPKSEQGKLKFPKLKTMSGKIYKQLKDCNLAGLSTNKQRGSEAILKSLLHLRKQVDKTELYPVLTKFAMPGSSQVYVLKNCNEFFGFDIFLSLFFNYLHGLGNKKDEQRSPGDAIRVAAVMLRPDFRGSVVGLLGGTRDRAKCDQSVEPAVAFSMAALSVYNDPFFVVEKPKTIDDDDIKNCDPNDDERIDLERNAEWFISTWKTYIKPKYKKAIAKWDKATGGGSSEPYMFSNFCEANRWLVWIYLMDIEADFLLFSNAKGRPPAHVGKEAGFSSSVSALSTPTSTKRKRCDEVQTAVVETQQARKKLSNVLDLVINRMDKINNQNTKRSGSDGLGSSADDIINLLIETNEQKEKLILIPLSPNSKDAVKATIDAKIKRLGHQLKKLNNTVDSPTGTGLADTSDSSGSDITDNNE